MNEMVVHGNPLYFIHLIFNYGVILIGFLFIVSIQDLVEKCVLYCLIHPILDPMFGFMSIINFLFVCFVITILSFVLFFVQRIFAFFLVQSSTILCLYNSLIK